MKNAIQLKAIIKNIAKNKKISEALVLQNYMLERFLERVSKPYAKLRIRLANPWPDEQEPHKRLGNTDKPAENDDLLS